MHYMHFVDDFAIRHVTAVCFVLLTVYAFLSSFSLLPPSSLSLSLLPPSLGMQASGGSGGYVWSCDPDTVAHVTSVGMVTSVAEGKAVVMAGDKKNSAHFDKSQVCNK